MFKCIRIPFILTDSFEFEQFDTKLSTVNASSSDYLIKNLEHLSYKINISSTNWKSWIEDDRIEKLKSSKSFQSKEVKQQLDGLIEEALNYQNLTEFALAIAEEILANITVQIIKLDLPTLSFVKENSATFDKYVDKLVKAGMKLPVIESILNEYGNGLNECMRNFADAVAPNLTQINTRLERISNQNHSEVSNIEIIKKEYENLIDLLIGESSVITDKSRFDAASGELKKLAREKAENCENYLKDVYEFIQALLKN